MAGGGNESLVKRNSKLEAFLQKHMDEDTFERVRAHEACIVCSRKEDKAFKFVILSDEWIYLTENPPRKIAEEVHMGDVVSINFVNDFPAFLSGAERQNTQHILVKYMRRELPKSRSKKPVDKPGEKPSPRSQSTLTYRGSLTARSSKQSPWAERKAQSLKEQSSKEDELMEARRNSIEAETLRDALDEDKGKKKKKKKGKEDENGKTNGTIPILKLPDGENEDEKGMSETKKSSLKMSHTYTGELRLALEKLDEQDTAEDTALLTTSRLHNNDNLSKSDSRLSFIKKMSEKVEFVESLTSEWLPSELHIYLLNSDSQLLMLARSAWDNYLIRETLNQDEEYLSRTKPLVETKKSDSEKFGLLYSQLKAELLMEEDNTLEEKFTIINELKVGAERNFCVKKLFWKTPDMLIYLIHQLQMYMPASPSRLVPDNQDDKCQRADELEYCILILETLCHMVRATEILPYRRSCMKSGQGKPLHDLAALLVCQPELPVFETFGKNTQLNPYNRGRCFALDSLEDEELEELCEELNTATTALLSELILITRQSNAGTDAEGFLTLNWLMKVIEEQEGKDPFVERVVVSAIQLLSPASIEELSPVEAIKLFQQFSVLQMIIENSTSTAAFIRENYYEEFKYYIQAPVILDKLPMHYPVSDATIKLIEDVMSRILGKSISLALNNILS